MPCIWKLSTQPSYEIKPEVRMCIFYYSCRANNLRNPFSSPFVRYFPTYAAIFMSIGRFNLDRASNCSNRHQMSPNLQRLQQYEFDVPEPLTQGVEVSKPMSKSQLAEYFQLIYQLKATPRASWPIVQFNNHPRSYLRQAFREPYSQIPIPQIYRS